MIYDVNKVDLMAKRKDGGIDMFIISTGSIDESPETQKLLLDKVDRYLGYVNSKEFVKDFPNVEKNEIQIVLEFEINPPELILELCQKIKPWAEDNGVSFSIKKRDKHTLKEMKKKLEEEL